MMVTAGCQINVFSDWRMKENIKSVDEQTALDVVRILQFVSFKYKNTDQSRVGWIAQEVIEHPLVQEAGTLTKMGYNENYTLCEQQMVPVLLAAIRGLAAEVEKLKNKK